MLKIMFLDAAYASLNPSQQLNFGEGDPLSISEIERIQKSFYPKSIFSISDSMVELGNDCFHYVANCTPVFSHRGQRRRIFEDLLARYWLPISRLPLLRILYEKSLMVGKFSELIEVYNPDILYILDPNLLTPRLGRRLGRQGRLLVGQIASPLPSITYFNSYDLMISADPLQVAYFAKNGIASEYLPSFAPKEAIGMKKKPLDLVERKISISFVGSFGRHHSQGTRTIQAIAKEFPEFEIYTDAPMWKLRLLGLQSNFAGKAWGGELQRIYNESCAVFNRHTNISRSNAVNTRMFEATAAGAVLLTERGENISDLFTEGVEVLCYSSATEALAHLRSVISNPAAYQEVANAGRKKTLTNHSSQKRLGELNKILERYLACKSGVSGR